MTICVFGVNAYFLVAYFVFGLVKQPPLCKLLILEWLVCVWT